MATAMKMSTASVGKETALSLQLPRADAFDVLPALHEMLSRIDHQAPTDIAHANIMSSPANDAEGSSYADLTPLEPRDLPNEILSIKTRIRRTLRELEKLPDMDRTTEQQEQEIEAMEKRIQQQRVLIEKLVQASRTSG